MVGLVADCHVPPAGREEPDTMEKPFDTEDAVTAVTEVSQAGVVLPVSR